MIQTIRDYFGDFIRDRQYSDISNKREDSDTDDIVRHRSIKSIRDILSKMFQLIRIARKFRKLRNHIWRKPIKNLSISSLRYRGVFLF